MNKYISNFIALVWACVGISWWVSTMWDVVLSVRLRTKTNESVMNKAGSPAIHTVPKRHIIWHRTWSTHLTSLSLCVHTHIHTLTHQSYNYIHIFVSPSTEGLSLPLTTKIGLRYTIWTISLLERLNIIVNGEGKSFWLRVKRLSTVTASVFLSELGGQSNQNGSGGDEKMDVPQSLALNLTTLYKKRAGCDLQHPLPPLSCPRLPLVSLAEVRASDCAWGGRESRASCGRTDQCHLCQGASQVTRAPSD